MGTPKETIAADLKTALKARDIACVIDPGQVKAAGTIEHLCVKICAADQHYFLRIRAAFDRFVEAGGEFATLRVEIGIARHYDVAPAG